MSRFTDPADADPSLSVANWDGNNLEYIVSREGPRGAMTRHYHTDPTKSVVPFDEEKTTPNTIIQVSLMVPIEWCRAIQGHLSDGTRCKDNSKSDMTPIAMNAKWSDFQPDPSGNGNMINTFNISTLGHAFEMVWAKSEGDLVRGEAGADTEGDLRGEAGAKGTAEGDLRGEAGVEAGAEAGEGDMPTWANEEQMKQEGMVKL